jgi:hypothetical protein
MKASLGTSVRLSNMPTARNPMIEAVKYGDNRCPRALPRFKRHKAPRVNTRNTVKPSAP